MAHQARGEGDDTERATPAGETGADETGETKADAGQDALDDEGAQQEAHSADSQDGAEDESPASLRAALEQARAETAAERDRVLRAVAETENVRKRTQRSIENAHKFALEKFVGDLLPAVDSFERAVDAAAKADARDETVKAIAEGVELSLKLLTDAMQRQGIEVVDPIGVPFDPKLHEAMSMLESATAEPGSVIEVFQKGYTVNGRLTRPARVIVAREPLPADDGKADREAANEAGASAKGAADSQDNA